MTDYNQYYGVAVATLFFYDFLLTLADEVSRVIGVSLRLTYRPWKGQVRLAWGELMEYAGNVGICVAVADDMKVFALFLAVRFLCSKALPPL